MTKGFIMNLSKLALAGLFISTSALVFPALLHASSTADKALSEVVEAGQEINQSANKSQQRVDIISE